MKPKSHNRLADIRKYRSHRGSTCLVLMFVLCAISVVQGVSVQSSRLPHSFQFTENKGQWDSAVVYKCEVRRDGFTWFLERDGVTLVTSVIDSTKPLDNTRFDPMDRDLLPRYALKSHALKFKFVGECTTQKDVGRNSDPRKYTCAKSIDAQGEFSWHNNYFLGNDSSKWAPDCRNFSRVVYHEVWDGIDVEWYESKGHLEFDFVIHPGADPKQIKMVCAGLDDPLDLTPDSQLLLPISLGELRMKIPGAYQTTANGVRGNDVEAQFRLLAGNLFAIDLPNGYDPAQTLRIDPLVYSTYLGGSGDDGGRAINYNNENHVTIIGSTESTNFPTTPGALDRTFNNNDCFVSQFNENRTELIFSTFLGGSNGDEGSDICNDGSSGFIIAGKTYSIDFPTTNGSRLSGISDGFITRLNQIGNQIIYSTTIGGSSGDDVISITSDSTGGCFITGVTQSNDFPTTTTAFQRILNGGIDCYIAHLSNDAMNLIASTYLGSSGNDGVFDLTRSRDGLVITGFSTNQSFPTTISSFDTTYNGGIQDCYIVKVDTNCMQLIYSTFLGGSGQDVGVNIELSSLSGVIVDGITRSMNFPVTQNAFDTTRSDSTRCFITLIDSSGSHLLHSTYFGTSLGITGPTAVKEDTLNSITIAGYTSCVNFPTSIESFDSDYNGGSFDCYLSKLDSSLSNLIYSTFLGGNGRDQAYGLEITRSRNFIIVGMTTSNNFPVSTNGYDTTYNGGTYYGDCFISCIQLHQEAAKENRFIFPIEFARVQNYPNPFNSSTLIHYSVPTFSHVKLTVFNLIGQQVSTLVDAQKDAGEYRVRFDAQTLPTGIYFYRLQIGKQVVTRKMMLLK